MPDRQLVSGDAQDDELQFEAGLRPRRLSEFTGQRKLKENLSIAIEAARMRGEAMDHVLLYGPPRLAPYNVDELKAIVKRSAQLLTAEIQDGAGEEIARRCRGTPRIANRLLRRVRDYAQVRADGRITRAISETALDLLDVDRYGLDEIDQKIMMTILEKYRGGPVGVNTIAASISEEAATIEEVYEPYLIQLGFLNRTPPGRVATELAYEYFKVKPKLPHTGQATFF